MTPDLVHSVWKFIQSPEALGLSGAAPEKLVAQVLESLNYELQLPTETELKVREYLLARTPLLSELLWQSQINQCPC